MFFRYVTHLQVFILKPSQYCPQVNGQTYTGQGRSKKLAKHAAAEAALRSFVQFKNAPEAQQAMNVHIADMDFTSDVTETEEDLFHAFQPSSDLVGTKIGDGQVKQVPLQNGTNTVLQALLSPGRRTGALRAPILTSDKSPVMLLNELRPGIKYECLSESGEPYAKFTMGVNIDDETFEGTGPSKKLGKAAAAKSALAKLYNLSFSPFSTPLQPARTSSTPSSVDQMVLPQVLADHISRLKIRIMAGLKKEESIFIANGFIGLLKSVFVPRLVVSKFQVLIENHPTHSRRKVLAGIVMTTGLQMDDAIVISVATGTKCINGEHMSERGASLNDTHAEIIARRCLCDYLYTQLEMHLNPDLMSQSIFVHREDKKGYKLRENVKFHLFINTAPCGDARVHYLSVLGEWIFFRIFSPHEAATQEDSLDKHPNRKARGQLRTKIESGEGTIPVKSSDGIQTWDGVLQGQRLLTMSCSDKIARWNVVGVQGALLSHFVEPIYLESIVLGSLFHPSHMYRAVCGRIENTVQGLPPPYRLNKPLMSLITSPEVRQPGKAPNYSVNWTVGKLHWLHF
uniref:Double-stranded RNA-specific editase 1 n=1 Tax=Timema bartmani TaxID=61472 RepID=A0A7R9EVL8_9NEOP|nr:unnamed protein product [Timema bartmani]